jgi:hypothetical protein
MEKETTNNSEHGKTCHWCGLDKGFSWTRLVLAILIGMFLFLLGIRIGQMGGSYNGSRMMERGDMRMNHYMMNGNDNIETRTIVIPAPSTPAAPAATTAPAVPTKQ